MKHFLLFLFLPILCLAQEQVGGRVLDAETGETLPYAIVYVESEKKALTNQNGEFIVTASPNDVLTFSYVGYEKLRIQASKMKPVVRLKPMSNELREVVVRPVDVMDILKELIKNLKRDYQKHMFDERGYFMRGMLSGLGDTYLIESFVKASSAVNIRDVAVISGRMGLNEEGNSSSMQLQFTNVQRIAGVAPAIYTNSYWEKAIKPLIKLKDTKKYYDSTIETLVGSEGERLYKIIFQWKEKERSEWRAQYLAERRHITGTAFVDAATLQLLRFDGKVENAFQWTERTRRPSDIRFQLTYDNSQGYAAVSNIAVRGGNEDMNYSILMFSLQDDDAFFRDNEGYSDRNVLSSLESAGYDATLWEKFDIVKRTEEEEQAALAKSLPKQQGVISDTPQAP